MKIAKIGLNSAFYVQKRALAWKKYTTAGGGWWRWWQISAMMFTLSSSSKAPWISWPFVFFCVMILVLLSWQFFLYKHSQKKCPRLLQRTTLLCIDLFVQVFIGPESNNCIALPFPLTNTLETWSMWLWQIKMSIKSLAYSLVIDDCLTIASIFTSAGNLFKFCRRAITEYQVAVSD